MSKETFAIIPLERYNSSIAIYDKRTVPAMLKDHLKEKQISIYSMSKACGIPYSTLNDLANGKVDIDNCKVGLLLKISDKNRSTGLMTPTFIACIEALLSYI